MVYRKAEEKDYEQISELAQKNEFHQPHIGVCFVAEQDGKIIGYINGGVVGFIESIVSENPISAVRLTAMLEGVIQNNVSGPIIAGVINDVAGKELEKFGYKEAANTKFYIRK